MTESSDGSEPRWERAIELFSVLLITLTAVIAAWSAFESSKWRGTMSLQLSEASALRTESVRQSNLANRQIGVDVSLFSSFADATAEGDETRADFYRQRFPERLSIAVDAWLETEPLTQAAAPSSPFDMPEYVVEASEEADQLERDADDRAATARESNQRGDNYTLTSIFLATVLFLTALSTKLRSVRLQRLLLIAACVVFVATAAVIATFPIKI